MLVDRPGGILHKNRQYVSVITRYLSYLIVGNNNKNALFIAVERTPRDHVTRSETLPRLKISRIVFFNMMKLGKTQDIFGLSSSLPMNRAALKTDS